MFIYFRSKLVMYLRVIVRFMSTRNLSFDTISKHTVQGFIYSLLRDTQYNQWHDKRGFKFFTFSDIFPSGDFLPGIDKNLIISSPSREFIKCLYESLSSKDHFFLGPFQMKLIETKLVDLTQNGRFISGSPIVLYLDNNANTYYSFRRHPNVDFFLERLKENAIKKFSVYYGMEANLRGPIFEHLVFKKEVAIKITKGEKSFVIIGSVWKLLEKLDQSDLNDDFYHFVMEAGLGEKNSLGFGFINPL
jgi:CRISPR-associated endoribonuclease Cas6